MAKDHGPSIKDDKQYEGLRKKGMSKSRAAAIANTPTPRARAGSAPVAAAAAAGAARAAAPAVAAIARRRRPPDARAARPPAEAGWRRRSAERDRHLLEEIQRVLQAVLHPGVDVRVAVLLAGVLHEHGEARAPVRFGERQGVQRLPVGHALVDLGRDEPLVRDDLAVLTVEADLEPLVGDHHVAPLAADPQV